MITLALSALEFAASKTGRILILVFACGVAFLVNNSHQRGIGEKNAVAKIEKATDNAIEKAHSAGSKSASGHGVQPLTYRD